MKKANYLIDQLTRKVKPSQIVSGAARVGCNGSEYLNPEKYIPTDLLDVVIDRIRSSTKRLSTTKLAEESKTSKLKKYDSITKN